MTRHRARPATRLGVAGAMLAIVGVAVIVIAAMAQHHAPQPPASAAVPVDVTPATSASTGPVDHISGRPVPPTDPRSVAPVAPGTNRPVRTPAGRTTGTTPEGTPGTSPAPQGPGTHGPIAPGPATQGPILARSVPIGLDIPAIGVHTSLLALGLNSDGTVQTPPLSDVGQAGWYRYSPTPGQLGPAVILGHIDSAQDGIGVFFYLGSLRQRDVIDVTLADHTVAVFEVTRVVEYPKTSFPTVAVYGNTDHAALRLITCGGTFGAAERSYESNIVAFATLVSSHPA